MSVINSGLKRKDYSDHSSYSYSRIVPKTRPYYVLFFSGLQMCDTWCNVAMVHETAKHEYDKIEDAYLKALDCAVKAGSFHAQVSTVPVPSEGMQTLKSRGVE